MIYKIPFVFAYLLNTLLFPSISQVSDYFLSQAKHAPALEPLYWFPLPGTLSPDHHVTDYFSGLYFSVISKKNPFLINLCPTFPLLPPLYSLVFFFKMLFIVLNFYWSITDLQCCVSDVQQSEHIIQIHISTCFTFFSHIGHYKVLYRVLCAIYQVFISYLFYIQKCEHFNPSLSISPPPLTSW